jgi:TorA maturation chaperone TorD/NAD-dependent dihydropyrimidine dehydrogenase PreA subunit
VKPPATSPMDSCPDSRVRFANQLAAQDAEGARWRSSEYARYAQALGEPRRGLESEFSRLFVGPGRPAAHPFESAHREGRMMGDCTMAVQRLFIREGLAPQRQSPSDHVGLELALMAHLVEQEATAWERGDKECAIDYMARQHAFLRNHLCIWLPRFCEQVLMAEPGEFYYDVAQSLMALVDDDSARLASRMSLSEPRALKETQGSLRTEIAIAAGCTLCGVCAAVCLPGALRIAREELQVSLHFAADNCTGCALCQEACPEDVITLSPSLVLSADERLITSELVRCPICATPHATRAMLERAETRLGNVSQVARDRILMCPTCKASAGLQLDLVEIGLHLEVIP